MSKCYICKKEGFVSELGHYNSELQKWAHRECVLIKTCQALVLDLERYSGYQGGSYAKSLKDLKELLSKYEVL